MNRPLLVFDTNVLMDLLLDRDGGQAVLLVTLAEAGHIQLTVPEYVLLEFRGTALRWARSETIRLNAGSLTFGRTTGDARVDLLRSGDVRFAGDSPTGVPVSARHDGRQNGLIQLESLAAGAAPDPLITPFTLYFHSYRRVLEGRESLGSLVQGPRPGGVQAPHVTPISVFKQELLRAMMGRAALFELAPDESAADVLAALNSLVQRYAKGTIDKLLPQPDDTFDFRVQPLTGGPTYSFDSLSSGQKEVISTLFLIWFFTRDQPAVVLIDEPELHLNPEWHRTFVRDLAGIAPNNQYILATHSEEIFASVDPAHRALLEPDGGAQ